MKDFLIIFATGPHVNIPGLPNVALNDATVANILSLTFTVVGAMSVLFILIGAVWYAISAGDPSNTKRAKDTILYAVIGLVVSVSAVAIVQFVVMRVVG